MPEKRRKDTPKLPLPLVQLSSPGLGPPGEFSFANLMMERREMVPSPRPRQENRVFKLTRERL